MHIKSKEKLVGLATTISVKKPKNKGYFLVTSLAVTATGKESIEIDINIFICIKSVFLFTEF